MLQQSNPSYFNTSDKVRIYYNHNFKREDITEETPVVVFNYGLVCNFAHFKYQLEFLEKNNINILIHDYRGHYNSGGTDDIKNCSFDNMVKDLDELTNLIGSKNLTFIGHSMGVNISLEFAKRFPDRAKKLVLISGTVVSPQDVMFDSNIANHIMPYLDWAITRFPSVYKKIWSTNFMNPLITKIVHASGFNVDKVSEEFVQTYVKKIGELPPEIFLKLFQEMHQHDILDHLDKIKCPTLIMGGDKDKIIPTYLQHSLHKKIKDSEIYIIKEGSHVPQADFPEMVNQRILSFIS